MTEEADTTGQNDINTGDADSQADGNAEGGVLLGNDSPASDDAGAVGDEVTTGEDGSEGSDDAPVVPDSYEFNLPEGATLADGYTDKLSEAYKGAGITQEGADAITSIIAEAEIAEVEGFNEQLNNWAKELKNDQDIGGEGFDENVAKINQFIDKTVPDAIADDFKGLLQSTGVGSHPAVVKYFHHMSKQFPVGEDNPGSGKPSRQDLSPEERLYPNEVAAK